MTDTQPRTEAVAGFGPGSRFGPYRVVREVGRGGMGVVYLAEHEELGRKVALKLLAARHAASEKALERFEREVRAVARLADPGIVAIYDVGRVEGVPFFTMEYVEGRTLHDVLQDLRQQRRTPESLRAADLADTAFGTSIADLLPEPQRRSWLDAACHVVACMADALSHVHAQGIVHRDVKPKNILLARDGRVLLFDFGVARVDTEASMTVSGEFVGTPFYVSPEQVDPPDEGVDERTDIYSLGVTLYELLTLEVPFDGDSPQQIFKRIVQREAKPLRRLNPQVPRDLVTVCQMAMAKERGRRYQSAADFAADLRRFLELKPVFARPVGLLGRVTLWARRKPAVAGLMIAALVLLLLLLVNWRQRREIVLERRAHALASFRYAQVLQQQGRFADAKFELERARAGGHDPVAVAVVLVETLEADGDEAAALRELSWLRGHPKLGEHAGRVFLLAGDLGIERLREPDGGLDLVQRAQASGQLDPADTSYARALLASDAASALRALEETLARQPLHVRARASYGPTLLSLGKREEAAAFAERMVASNPGDVRSLLFSALSHALLGDPSRASADLENARVHLGPVGAACLDEWSQHLSIASQGSSALLRTVLHGGAAISGGGPIDAPRLLVALAELLRGIDVVDERGRRRCLRFGLPPAVARGYARLVQAFTALGASQLTESDQQPLLRLLDEALAVHPDGLRYLLRGLLGHTTRGHAALVGDLEQAARTPSMVAIEQPAMLFLLRAQVAALVSAPRSEEREAMEQSVRATVRRFIAHPVLAPDVFPVLLEAARAAAAAPLALELLLRWARESPHTLPAADALHWPSEADAVRSWRTLLPAR